MTMHPTGTREEWVRARKELLEREKALTRQSDELARRTPKRSATNVIRTKS